MRRHEQDRYGAGRHDRYERDARYPYTRDPRHDEGERHGRAEPYGDVRYGRDERYGEVRYGEDRLFDDRYGDRQGRDEWYRPPDFHGSEVDADRQRRDGGPRYHGRGWEQADEEYDLRRGNEPMQHGERRRAQGEPAQDWDRPVRRHGERLIDDGELRRPRGGWDRRDDHRWSGRGLGGDVYGGPDRGYDSLIPPMADERGRYDAGRFDAPDHPDAHGRYWSPERVRRGEPVLWDEEDRRHGGVAGGELAGIRHRR